MQVLGKAAEGPVASEDAVAGQEEGKEVVLTGAAGGACGFGVAGEGSKPSIGKGRPEGDLLHSLPGFVQEGGLLGVFEEH